MLMTKERELKDAVREGRDRVSTFDDSRSGKRYCYSVLSQCS